MPKVKKLKSTVVAQARAAAHPYNLRSGPAAAAAASITVPVALVSTNPVGDGYFSDYPSSDDDDLILDEKQKFVQITRHGPDKLDAYQSRAEDFSLADGKFFVLEDPRDLKGFAAQRSDATGTDQDYFTYAHQNHRMGNGAGQFVQAGGNVRPAGIKEPLKHYRTLFGDLVKGRTGPDAQNLLLAAWDAGVEHRDTPLGDFVAKYPHRPVSKSAKTFSDPQVAALVYYTWHANAEVLGEYERTQLTENLEKMVAIFTAEGARAFSAEPFPYDCSVILKHCLREIMLGTWTLEAVFFSGEKSIFPGAPTSGGAAVLKDPDKYWERYGKLMASLPAAKGDLKRYFRRLRTSLS